MSSTPNGTWIDQGFRQDQSNQPPAASRKPLYFLVFASAVLAITVMAIFFIKVMNVGQSAAGNETRTSSKETTKNEETTKGGDLQEARDAVKKLAEKPSCSKVEDDASTIITFAKAAINENSYNSEKKTISDSMSKLSKECGAEYTLSLAKATAKGPSNLADLANSHSWWYLKSRAPEDARDITEFKTPTDNIRCKFGQDRVACSIYAYDYPSPQGCEGKTATYTLGLSGDVTADCNSSYNSSVTANYGTTVSHNGVWCSIEQTEGVTCTSELTGKGFQIKRAAERRF